MPDKPSELKPCPTPWCDIPRPPVAEFGLTGFVVTCEMCGTTTPEYKSQDEAIAAWNRRTHDRAALVEVARRALEEGRMNRVPGSQEEAERIVTEYLAEQAGKEGE